MQELRRHPRQRRRRQRHQCLQQLRPNPHLQPTRRRRRQCRHHQRLVAPRARARCVNWKILRRINLSAFAFEFLKRGEEFARIKKSFHLQLL